MPRKIDDLPPMKVPTEGVGAFYDEHGYLHKLSVGEIRQDERAKAEGEIASAIRRYDPGRFVCPECGSRHFGTHWDTVGDEWDWGAAIRDCHDEFQVGCRFKGTPGQNYPDPIYEKLAVFIERGDYRKPQEGG